MMLILHLPNEVVRVETIVEAREAAIIFMREEYEDPTAETCHYEFRLCNSERLIGVIAGGLFFRAH